MSCLVKRLGGLPPEIQDKNKGSTGRFVPCPAGLWRHPEDPVACEVRWSLRKKAGGVQKLSFFFMCSTCEPPTRTFLNDWDLEDGYTLLTAEQRGYRPKASKKRREELLKELGVKEIQAPIIPLSPPKHYAPLRGKKPER